jgi:hypothetical protein
LASNFSDEPATGPVNEVTPVAPVDTRDPVTVPALSPAVERFRSCRWRRPPEDGIECCTHRDVLPMAGTTGFNADAWCPGCEHFKAKRAPRKRQEREEYW